MPKRRRRRFRRRRLAVLAICRKWRGYHHSAAVHRGYDSFPPLAAMMERKLDQMVESFRCG